MPVKPSKKLAIVQRRQQVADLYLQGWTQMAIAEHVQVGQATVSTDLKAIQDEWRSSSVRDFDLIREVELRKLSRLERECWAAWERSQKPMQSADIKGDGAGAATRKRVKNQYGDPRFLAQINQCIVSRRALLGLDMAVTPLESIHANISLEDRRHQVFAVIATLRERERIAGPGAEPGDVQSRDLCPTRQPG